MKVHWGLGERDGQRHLWFIDFRYPEYDYLQTIWMEGTKGTSIYAYKPMDFLRRVLI